MSFVRQTIKDAAIGVGIADDPGALRTFLQPGCAAAIWRRQTPRDLQSWLDGLDPDLLPQGRVVLPANAVADTVRHLFDMSGLPPGSERDWLLDDIASLAELFTGFCQRNLT